MSDVQTHLIFIGVSLAVAAFLLLMRSRMRAQYPDDDSKQMRSMLGFMRGTAMFALLIAFVVGVDAVRRLI